MQQLKDYGKWLFIAISSLIILGHGVLLILNSVDIPHWGDYDAILKFLNEFTTGPSVVEKLRLIYHRHNEHRIILTRLPAILVQWLSGHVNFIALIAFTNVLLVLLFLMIARFYYHLKYGWYLILPLPLLLFNISSSENMFWALAGIQSYGLLLFSLSSIILLFSARGQNTSFSIRFWCSLSLGIIASFCGANGFLSLIFCCITIWFTGTPFIYSLCCTICTGIILMTQLGGESNGQLTSAVQNVLTQPKEFFTHFFILIGNCLNPYTKWSSWFVPMVGCLLSAGFAWLVIVRRIYKTDLAHFLCLVFLFCTCGMISLARSSAGADQAFSSRYIIYSAMIVVFLYPLFLSHRVHTERLPTASLIWIVIISLLFLNSYWENIPLINQNKTRLKEGADSYYNAMSTSLSYPDQNYANLILARSESLGVYTLPGNGGILNPGVRLLNNSSVEPTHGIMFNVEEILNDNSFAIINGWAFVSGSQVDPEWMDLILKSDKHTYLKRCRMIRRGDVSAHFNNDSSLSGFKTTLLASDVEAGNYEVGILIQISGKAYIEFFSINIALRKP